MVSSLDIVLPICESGHCELHPVTDWPRLDEICTNLLGSLKEIVLRVSDCSDDNTNQWLKDFVGQQGREGKNICLASTLSDEDAAPMFAYYWGAAAEDTACLTNLIMKTCRGKIPIIRIWGGNQEAALPPNIFQVLSNQAKNWRLKTDTKIKNISGILNHLNSCLFLDLFNDGPIQEDEVAAMEAILAHVAQEPRPLNPFRIILPKVTISLYLLSFLPYVPLLPSQLNRIKQFSLILRFLILAVQALFDRTIWRESPMLRRTNKVTGCEDQDGECYRRENIGECEGCVSIEALEDDDSDDDSLDGSSEDDVDDDDEQN